MKNDLNFNQICGKIIKDARESKNISIEDLAFYLLPTKEEKVYKENNELDEYKNTNLAQNVEMSYLRKKIFENSENEKLYQENIKKINYWEKGNGFPDLNEIYKLANFIDIDPNEIYKYRELGRKNLKGENNISKWKFYINRTIENNLDALRVYFPTLVMVIVIWFLLRGGAILEKILNFFNIYFGAMK